MGSARERVVSGADGFSANEKKIKFENAEPMERVIEYLAQLAAFKTSKQEDPHEQ